MFKLKELLDGVIEDVLEFPAMWVRTHVHALCCGRRAPFIIARNASRDKRYLTLRTAAFLDLLIIYAVSQASNAAKGAFSNNFLAVMLAPQNIDLKDSAFVSLLVALFAFYYVFYVVIAGLRIDPRIGRVLAGACVFYSMLCLLFTFVVFLLLFGSSSPIAKDFVLRGAIYGFNVFAFWRVGAVFSSRLRLGRRLRWEWLGTSACTLACLVLYASVIIICFGWESLWPNLNA
jgi:hypothetical protein